MKAEHITSHLNLRSYPLPVTRLYCSGLHKGKDHIDQFWGRGVSPIVVLEAGQHTAHLHKSNFPLWSNTGHKDIRSSPTHMTTNNCIIPQEYSIHLLTKNPYPITDLYLHLYHEKLIYIYISIVSDVRGDVNNTDILVLRVTYEPFKWGRFPLVRCCNIQLY